MPIGKVKWFNNSKGYGFIESENGEEVFAHYSNIRSDEEYKKIHEDDRVEFEVENGEKGPKAINIRRI